MFTNHNYNVPFRCFTNGAHGSRPITSSHERTALLAFVLAATLVMALAAGAMLHAGEPGQTIVPHQSADDTGLIQDLVAFAPLPGYAFAQTQQDDTPPTFVSSGLNLTAGNLAIRFSEAIDVTPAANVVPSKIHVRESGSYTGGVTLTAVKLGTTADGATISFTLNDAHIAAVAAMGKPELTIDPGAVRDTSGNLIVGTFDASTAVFVDATSVESEDDDPRGMTFSNDGTKMFVVGNQGGAIIEYTLSPAFDASTANFTDTFSVFSKEDVPTGMAFSKNGTKMFVVGYVGTNVTEYTLPTAFNVSTAVFVDTFSVSSEFAYSSDITFSNDGTKMFVVNLYHDIITEYILSAAFAVSTADFVPPSFSVTSEETYPTGMTFSNDGAKMFVVGDRGEAVNEYTLFPAFDVSTAVFVDATLISSEDIYLTGVAFSNDGAKMFVVENDAADIHEYTLSSVYPITVTGITIIDNDPTIYAGDGLSVTKGSTVILIGATATDNEDNDSDLEIAWTQSPANTVIITNANTLRPTIDVPSITSATSVTLTLSVTDSGGNIVTEAIVLTIQDAVNTALVLDEILPKTAYEHEPFSFNVTVTDDDGDTLKYYLTGNVPDSASITLGGLFTWTPSEEQDGTHIFGVLVSDLSDGTDTQDITITVNEVNVAPVLNPIDSRNVTALVPITFRAIVLDGDIINGTADSLTFSLLNIPDGASLNSTTGVFSWTPAVNQVGLYNFAVSVTDGDATDIEYFTVMVQSSGTIIDNDPIIYAGDGLPVTKGSTVILTGATATDNEDNDSDLEIAWTQSPANTVIITNANTLRPTIDVPSITSATSVTLTLSVTDSGGNIVTEAIVLTIQDAVNTAPTVYAGDPLRVALGLSVSTNPTVDDPDGDTDHTYTWTQSPVNTITFSDVNSLRPTIIAPANTTVTDVRLTLTVVDGEYTVDAETTLNIYDPATISNKKSSSSSSIAPIVDLNTLAQARIVDIPSAISEQISSHDASDPLEPILHNDTFDCPLTINEYCYLLDDTANTLTPQTVTADQSTEIAFTVYTKKDLTHFTLYLNMRDDDVNYADSDTYITYTGDGTVDVTDPHGYIGSTTVTVTQEDDHIPEKKTVSITVQFEEPMGPTNMVAYMWNTDRKATFIKIIDAFEVAASPEPVMQAADPEPLEPDSVLSADPEPMAQDFTDDAADPASSDTLWPDDYDDAQVLTLIRMWSGFESELITDTQLLELLGLEDYQDVDLPDWMMAELGVLVAKGDVTVDEFMLALQYMLTHA